MTLSDMIASASRESAELRQLPRGSLDVSLDESSPSPKPETDEFVDPLAELWRSRPALAHIQQAAHSRSRSAPAVLGCVLARIAAQVPPTVVLPAIVGSVGSLNLFVAIIGNPSAGKSTSNQIAAELVPITDQLVRDDLPLGSGEGLIDAYYDMVEEPSPNGRAPKLSKKRIFNGCLFYVDEGATLGSLGHRKGSTVLETLRGAWTGSTLGQTNASTETRRKLASQSYRLALIVGYQPSTAAALLESAGEGTPQRFEWVNAVDPTIPDDAPSWPGPLSWTLPTVSASSAENTTETIKVDPNVAADIRSRSVAVSQGKASPPVLDAHNDLAQLKLAALLGILDNRLEVSPEDWHLAGVIRHHTRTVRGDIVAQVALDATRKDNAYTRKLVNRDAAIIDDRTVRATARMARSIAKKIHAEGEGTRRVAQQAAAGRDRRIASIDDAIEEARHRQWIVVDGDRLTPGSTKPT